MFSVLVESRFYLRKTAATIIFAHCVYFFLLKRSMNARATEMVRLLTQYQTAAATQRESSC